MASEGGLGGPEGGPGDGIAWNGGERGLSSFEGAFFLRGGFLPSRGLSSFEGGFLPSRGAFFLRGGLSFFERGFLPSRGAFFLREGLSSALLCEGSFLSPFLSPSFLLLSFLSFLLSFLRCFLSEGGWGRGRRARALFYFFL